MPFYVLAYQISGRPAQYGGGMVMKVETSATSMQMADHTQQQQQQQQQYVQHQQQQQYIQQQQLIQMQQGRKNAFGSQSVLLFYQKFRFMLVQFLFLFFFVFADTQGASQYIVHHQQQRGSLAYGQQSMQQVAYDSRSVLSYFVLSHFLFFYLILF